MKILALHSDFIEFEAKKKAIKAPEKIEKKSSRIEECLVVFVAVERRDETNPGLSAENLSKNIVDIASTVNTRRIILYPYVHLTNQPSSAKTGLQVLQDAEEKLRKEFEVHRSPFGWYKSFSISVKGHPLSELSREFGPEKESDSLKKERKLASYWYILTEDGKLNEVGSFDYTKHQKLKKFALYEKEKSRAVRQEPPHVKLMKKLELVDYEPASDGGNLRYYPKGRLIKRLLEEYVTERIIDYGGIEVETPIMYDIDHPTLSKYLQRFPARQYQIESDKRKFFLRFAACFGQFLMAHDATISYKDLPLKLYELTRYSFRREQSGELTGLRRLRAFTMPDVHALVKDMDQAKQELEQRFELSMSVLADIGIADVEMALRTTKDYFDENKEFIMGLVRRFGRPVLLEMWDERIFYFALKYELNFVDNLDKASALSTDQIDIENGERYDIRFTGKDGKQRHPLILHCSPSGAIERVIYALLEQAASDMKKGTTPKLPLWLSPVQVRVIPVSDDFADYAGKVMKELGDNIRVDIDDRPLHVGKKIREAETSWIPYVAVVGEKEKTAKKISVRIRGINEQKLMKAKELIAEIHKKTEGMPFRRLPLPQQLSKQPVFVG